MSSIRSIAQRTSVSDLRGISHAGSTTFRDATFRDATFRDLGFGDLGFGPACSPGLFFAGRAFAVRAVEATFFRLFFAAMRATLVAELAEHLVHVAFPRAAVKIEQMLSRSYS